MLFERGVGVWLRPRLERLGGGARAPPVRRDGPVAVFVVATPFGPSGSEGGVGGGRIVAQGTPEEVARSRESYTGQFLADILGLPPALAS